jgi:predicted permease
MRTDIGSLLRRLAALFRRHRLDRDLDDELSFHLAMRQEEAVRRGSSAKDADHAARRQFGNVLRVKEQSKEAWLIGWLEIVVQDVRFALRGLRRSPAFAIVAVATLALGIGGTVEIFSVVNAVLLRPLPFADSDRVVYVQGNRSISGRPDAMWLIVPTEDLPRLREASTTLSHFSVINVRPVRVGEIGDSDGAVDAQRAHVSPAAFHLFDRRPLIGRGLEPRDEEPGTEEVVVLSYGAWRKYFGGATDVAGRRVNLNDYPHTIIGVMPQGFSFPTPDVEMWSAWTYRPPAGSRTMALTIARLNDGVSIEAATSEINAVFLGINPIYSRIYASEGGAPLKLVPVKEQMIAPVRPALLVALAAVGLVLLIACSNIATLLLARAAGRKREVGIRSSLGASRWRIGQQVITESVVLALLGGAAGTFVAFGFVRVLPALELAHIPRLIEVQVDGAFLLSALAITLATSLLFGCAPALRMIGPRFGQTTPTVVGFSASSAPSLGRNRTRAALTVVQVALAVMLLIGAGLLGGSFVHLARFDLGYNPDNVVSFAVPTPPTRYSDAEQNRIQAEILDRLLGMTGGSGAAMTRLPTLPGGTGGGLLQIPGVADGTPAQIKPVSREYFDVLQLRLVEGRVFDDTDRPGQPLAVVVSQHLAAAFPDGLALGRTAQVKGLLEGIPLRVVGVVGDVVASSVEAIVRPDMYVLIDQLPTGARFQSIRRSMSFVVRVNGDPLTIVPTVRSLVRQVDERLVVDNVSTLRDLVSATVAQPRTNAALLGIFASIAVLLTAIGIYGLIAYIVIERTQEIGIRMAVGAAGSDVLALVMGQSALLVVPGIVLGLGGAAGLTRYLETMLYGLTPLDARTFAAVPVVVVLVMLAASYLPARRATKVDPLVALRCE